MADSPAGHIAMIRLLKLIAVSVIVQEKREVRKQVQVRRNCVARHVCRTAAVGALPLDGSTVAIRVSSVRRIEAAESSDQPFAYCALRNLIGRIPRRAVRHPGQRESVQRVAARESQHPVDLAKIVRPLPRTIVVNGLESGEQKSSANAG